MSAAPDATERPACPFALPVRVHYDKDNVEFDLYDADNDRLTSIRAWDGGEAILDYIAAAINTYAPPTTANAPTEPEGPTEARCVFCGEIVHTNPISLAVGAHLPCIDLAAAEYASSLVASDHGFPLASKGAGDDE